MNKKFNPNKRLRDENSMEEVLHVLMKGYKLEAGLDQLNVKEAWKSLMGPGVASYTLDVVLKKNILFVALSSAVLREELTYGKQKIIQMMNEELRSTVIKDLIFK